MYLETLIPNKYNLVIGKMIYALPVIIDMFVFEDNSLLVMIHHSKD